MSDDLKIKDSNENEDMVDEVVEDFTMENSEKNNDVKNVSKKVINKDSERKPNFFASCAAAISDAVIIGVLSFVLLYVIDFILRKIVGVYIVDKNQMLFILYVVVSLLYVSILESTLGFTVGKTVLGIKVARN